MRPQQKGGFALIVAIVAIAVIGSLSWGLMTMASTRNQAIQTQSRRASAEEAASVAKASFSAVIAKEAVETAAAPDSLSNVSALKTLVDNSLAWSFAGTPHSYSSSSLSLEPSSYLPFSSANAASLDSSNLKDVLASFRGFNRSASYNYTDASGETSFSGTITREIPVSEFGVTIIGSSLEMLGPSPLNLGTRYFRTRGNDGSSNPRVTIGSRNWGLPMSGTWGFDIESLAESGWSDTDIAARQRYYRKAGLNGRYVFDGAAITPALYNPYGVPTGMTVQNVDGENRVVIDPGLMPSTQSRVWYVRCDTPQSKRRGIAVKGADAGNVPMTFATDGAARIWGNNHTPHVVASNYGYLGLLDGDYRPTVPGSLSSHLTLDWTGHLNLLTFPSTELSDSLGPTATRAQGAAIAGTSPEEGPTGISWSSPAAQSSMLSGAAGAYAPAASAICAPFPDAAQSKNLVEVEFNLTLSSGRTLTLSFADLNPAVEGWANSSFLELVFPQGSAPYLNRIEGGSPTLISSGYTILQSGVTHRVKASFSQSDQKIHLVIDSAHEFAGIRLGSTLVRQPSHFAFSLDGADSSPFLSNLQILSNGSGLAIHDSHSNSSDNATIRITGSTMIHGSVIHDIDGTLTLTHDNHPELDFGVPRILFAYPHTLRN